MPEAPHPYDDVAQQLYDWMEEQSDWAADALRGGYRAPFGADVSERDKADYYRRQMYQTNPDGLVNYNQPNAEGRKMLLDRLGTSGYAQVYNEIKPAQGRRPEPTNGTEPDMLE